MLIVQQGILGHGHVLELVGMGMLSVVQMKNTAVMAVLVMLEEMKNVMMVIKRVVTAVVILAVTGILYRAT